MQDLADIRPQIARESLNHLVPGVVRSQLLPSLQKSIAISCPYLVLGQGFLP